jgi:hypothetical protein
MGLSICIYEFNGGDDCPCIDDEIWQSCYSTFTKFTKDAETVYPNIRWPEEFKYNDEMCWNYDQGMQLAQDLKIALLNVEFSDKWNWKVQEFIEGLERAYDLKYNLVLC